MMRGDMKAHWLGMAAATFVVTLALGCGSPSVQSRDAEAGAASEPGHGLETEAADDSGIARYPFSAEQIRDAMPVGFWTRFRMEPAGQPPSFLTTTVVAWETDHVTLSNQLQSAEGDTMGEPVSQEASWVELQHHATFPADATLIEDQTVETPSGSWDCWVYTVTVETPEGGVDISRYSFAKQKPGAPVRYEQSIDGERVFLMTLEALGGRTAAESETGR